MTTSERTQCTCDSLSGEPKWPSRGGVGKRRSPWLSIVDTILVAAQRSPRRKERLGLALLPSPRGAGPPPWQ